MESGLQVEWEASAVRDMRRLTARVRNRIIAKVEQYADDPATLANQVIALAGSPYRRMRVGGYRVIFNVESDTIAVMVILRVRHRREAYG